MKVTSSVIRANERKTITGTAHVIIKAKMVMAMTGFSAAYFLDDSQNELTAGGTRKDDILCPVEHFNKK